MAAPTTSRRTPTQHPPARRIPAWVPTTSLGLSLVALAIASYLTVTHYTDLADKLTEGRIPGQ